MSSVSSCKKISNIFVSYFVSFITALHRFLTFYFSCLYSQPALNLQLPRISAI
jgi:hypothetical protein